MGGRKFSSSACRSVTRSGSSRVCRTHGACDEAYNEREIAAAGGEEMDEKEQRRETEIESANAGAHEDNEREPPGKQNVATMR